MQQVNSRVDGIEKILRDKLGDGVNMLPELAGTQKLKRNAWKLWRGRRKPWPTVSWTEPRKGESPALKASTSSSSSTSRRRWTQSLEGGLLHVKDRKGVHKLWLRDLARRWGTRLGGLQSSTQAGPANAVGQLLAGKPRWRQELAKHFSGLSLGDLCPSCAACRRKGVAEHDRRATPSL